MERWLSSNRGCRSSVSACQALGPASQMLGLPAVHQRWLQISCHCPRGGRVYFSIPFNLGPHGKATWRSHKESEEEALGPGGKQVRKRKRQDPGQTSQRSCRLLARLPHACPSAEGGSPADTTTATDELSVGPGEVPTHERKQLCLRQWATHTAGSVPSKRRGWPRAGPGCSRKGKARGAETTAGSNGGM